MERRKNNGARNAGLSAIVKQSGMTEATEHSKFYKPCTSRRGEVALADRIVVYMSHSLESEARTGQASGDFRCGGFLSVSQHQLRAQLCEKASYARINYTTQRKGLSLANNRQRDQQMSSSK
jgi:hypothetical protein